MPTESQPEPITGSESVVLGESVESKSNRGGKRAGAGRKPNLAKLLLKGFSKNTLAEAVANVDVGAVVTSLLKSKKEKTKLETLIFLRDTLWGRPAQNVSVSGGVLHAHTVWRPLASLSDEEVQALDAITRKLVAPPDAHQNQIESKPALEAEVVGSEPQESSE